MKKNKVIFILVSVILLILISIGSGYYVSNRRVFQLNLPQLDRLTNITLEKNGAQKVMDNVEEMKEVLAIFNGVERTTKKESINDTPQNAENTIKIDFHTKENETSTIFVYEKKDNYYIEQPYNGIYTILLDEYNLVANKAKITPRMVMVGGRLYYDTQTESTIEARCGNMDGEITLNVSSDSLPTIDNQSNFNGKYGYQYGMGDTIEIRINDKWIVFKPQK